VSGPGPEQPDVLELLRTVRSILLVDWPNAGVPRALLEAGLIVYAACPGRYSLAELLDAPPDKGEVASVLPPESEGETSFLVFRRLDAPPPSVDVVAVYRPSEEIPGIITAQVLPLGARILWLQPPITSSEARRTAADRGLRFIEGVDIATTARQLSGR
jgi:hypothetical protein